MVQSVRQTSHLTHSAFASGMCMWAIRPASPLRYMENADLDLRHSLGTYSAHSHVFVDTFIITSFIDNSTTPVLASSFTSKSTENWVSPVARSDSRIIFCSIIITTNNRSDPQNLKYYLSSPLAPYVLFVQW